MSFASSHPAGEQTSPQMHVFASLYSFSKEARLNIVCTDDNTIAALFQLYTDYISAERDRAREAYEVRGKPQYSGCRLISSTSGDKAGTSN
ncbi:MAG: hypothetical protein Q9185_000207 [Variospora sp. 1 TL-2023]